MNIRVQNKLYTSNLNLSSKANSSNGSMPAANEAGKKAQTNPLVDKNYGSLLVKPNNVAFKGASAVVPTLGKKISNMLCMMRKKDVLLVAKDQQAAIALLKESVASFKGGVRQVYLLLDPNLEETFAVHVKGYRKQVLINLAKDSLKLEAKNSNASFTITKGGMLPLKSGDKILTKNDKLELSLIDRIGYNAKQDTDRTLNEVPLFKVGYSKDGHHELKEPNLNAGKKPKTKIGYTQDGKPERKTPSPEAGQEPKYKIGYTKDGKPEIKTPSPEAGQEPKYKIGYTKDGKPEVKTPSPDAGQEQPTHKVGYTKDGKLEKREPNPNAGGELTKVGYIKPEQPEK